MANIEIDTPNFRRLDDGEHLSAKIRSGGLDYEVYFKTRNGPICIGVEPFLALGLLPAMRRGQGLRVAHPVSSLLLSHLQLLQARFAQADPRLRIIKVTAEAESPPQPLSERRVGVFFSGGVDSFFTLLERHDEITDLIFVHGFDIPLTSHQLHRVALQNAQDVAGHMGKHLIQVETNLRHFGDRHVDWGEHLYGPALAAVAHLLSPQIRRAFIPGEYLGSSRLVASRLDIDPLWTTEMVQILHHGHDVTRFEKLGRIGSHPLVRRSLRVCWENRNGRFNCGICSKCLRNMAALRAHGILEQVKTFEHPLDLGALSRITLPWQLPHIAEGLREILSRVEREGSDPELASALRGCIHERYHRSRFYGPRRILRSLLTRLWPSKAS
jgi:hypothetical protein